MTELKTLKELGGVPFALMPGERIVYENTLKQEAIKWVKELRKIHSSVAAHEFMTFFNITEEELKDATND